MLKNDIRMNMKGVKMGKCSKYLCLSLNKLVIKFYVSKRILRVFEVIIILVFLCKA